MSAYGSTRARRRVIEGVLDLTPDAPMEMIEDLFVYRAACFEDAMVSLTITLRERLSPAIARAVWQVEELTRTLRRSEGP